MSAKVYVLRGAVPMDSNPMPNHIWAFDLGKGSIGEAVRVGPVFKHKAALLIPGDFAETRTARTRRRMWRTRQAHHAREQWLREVFQAAGLGDAILQGRQVGKVDGAGNPIPREEWPRRKGKWVGSAKGDRRLEQEFPSEGDDTCYTSCLLRIKLLRGEKLEPWQVFKAFHSAIQRRGYDPDIPWKTREARRKGEAEAPDDEAGTQQRMRDFEKALHAMAPGQPDCQFPAYFDAWKMKLWHPAQPGELRLRVDCHAASTRNQIVPTGRIRRKYGLNRILNPNAADEEEAEKKNRNDDRHHALDAMVISFIPGWVRDAKKEGFFRFPDGVNREFFAQEIAGVMPQNLCFEKPALAETIYGARGEDAGRVIVQRVELFKLAMKGIAPGKTKFDLDYLAKQINAVRDGSIRRKLSEFHAASPDEGQWKEFCDNFCLAGKSGQPGSQVRRVLMNVGEPTQYKDLSKDGKGAWRKRKKDHRGQIIVAESGDSWRVMPVYVFESPAQKLADFKQAHPQGKTHGFFQSGCLVAVSDEVPHRKKPLPPGTYKLRTLRDDGYVQIEDQQGRTYPDWPLYGLANLIAAGFRRID